MTEHKMHHSVLIYNETEIRAVGERLNLTDMWKAAGSPSGRAPGDWIVLESTKEFVSHVELIAGISGNLVVTKTGRNGRTEAHWQIGIAYAKYLSPEFHMWANQVVRNVMEGKPALDGEDHDMIRRTDGISRMLAHKVTGIEKMTKLLCDATTEQWSRLDDLESRIGGLLLAADGRVAALEYVSVKELLNEAKAVQKGRNSINRKIGRELRDRALLSRPPLAVRKCPHSGVWLFPRDFAGAYMVERGNMLVADHNARQAGQGVIKFPRHKPIATHALEVM